MESIECIVIGAGVIGLAIGRHLALAGREVLVLEKEDCFGSETSSRNSEVIHAGIYYAAGSLKARLCVAGRESLYRYCSDHGVPHRRLGKLIVATSEDEIAGLRQIEAKALGNGVADLVWLSAAQALAMEPALACAAALHSPSTGIVDSHALMLAYLGDLENAGGVLALRTPFIAASRTANGFAVRAGNNRDDTLDLACRVLVNAGGLHAQAVAAAIAGLDARRVPPRYLSKGCYFSLAGRAPFSHLIYPVPGNDASLGVHLTLDMAGQARFGPDATWVDGIDYDVPAERAAAFYDAIRRYYPALANDSLQPAYAGIRPKLQGPGQAAADFVIQGPATHGISGLVNLFGIESPGLTASLAIAQTVVAALAAD